MSAQKPCSVCGRPDGRVVEIAILDLLQAIFEAPTMQAGYEILADFTEHAGLGLPVSMRANEGDRP